MNSCVFRMKWWSSDQKKFNNDRNLHHAEVAVMSDPVIKKKITERMDDYMMRLFEDHSGGPSDPHTVEEAGRKFANILLHNIYAEKFTPNLEARFENVEVGTPFKISDGHYGIYIYFEDDLMRDSMSTLKVYPEVNLAYLYNNGVDHIMPQIWEWDKTTKTLRVSNTEIPFTGFMEGSIDDFLGNYGSEYNVIRLEIIEGMTQ